MSEEWLNRFIKVTFVLSVLGVIGVFAGAIALIVLAFRVWW